MQTVRTYRRWFAALGFVMLAGLGCSRTKVWVERTETFDLPATTNNLYVRTHNGAVSITGDVQRSDVAVTVRVRGGGKSHDSATESLAAIEVVSEAQNDGMHKLDWRWTETRHSDWEAQVSFKIASPELVACDVQTHNGAVTVAHLAGPCKLETHNGKVSAEGIGGDLVAVTHNGGINARVAGSTVNLETHNGAISVDARECESLGGTLLTHNGGVKLKVGDATSADIVAQTQNGSVRCAAELANVSASRSALSGRLGEGGPKLEARTYNGGINIE
ncbi:MAG: DUF4097 family beta strand repeat protein [Phycisphaerales bacterium]|nr:DUF4097 family beta strand repeat protein [Phycisphaerales bacterium]